LCQLAFDSDRDHERVDISLDETGVYEPRNLHCESGVRLRIVFVQQPFVVPFVALAQLTVGFVLAGRGFGNVFIRVFAFVFFEFLIRHLEVHFFTVLATV
jgi:hypothetical protein